MNKKMCLKSSRMGICALLTAGFLYVGSYGQDSAAKKVAVQPAPATATTAVNPNTVSSCKEKNEKAQAPEAEFTMVVEPKECVAVGYGTKKRENVTGSVASVKSDKLTKTPTSNVLNALQGKAAGVNVMRNGGTWGAPMAVRIRGMGSINNNDPLYVVDGVRVNSLDYLNPNDVESVSILKDASETAIYGSRGANGVVLVTTKTAK